MKGAYNRFSYLFAMEASWRLFREPIDRVRAEVLDLPPLTVPYRKLVNQPIPILYGYSTHVLPRPKDWHDHLHLTGYWFLDNDLDWQPPAELVDFLDDGPPPVYIGFGSMSGGDAERLADVSLKALQSAGQRGILLTGWGGLDKSDLPDTVLKLAAAPHQWLFPRMSGVVHHGGAGTVSAGLRAGVPSLAIPFFADQPFWGAQLFKLGVGPAPISRKRLTANRLGYALRRMADHEGMRQRAADIGARIRAEDGVGEAVRLFEHYIGQ
jgi:UDP:flavonoid glycosyltransferase YjiC (YdhE family)